jgi:hypothetical protein
MSETIFAFLLRLYPARFRQRYQAEALDLFCARLRDERGLATRLRLWMDLMVDFVVGLPLAYRNSYAPLETAAAGPRASGLPAFRTLEEEPLRPGSIVMGGILAVGALAIFVFVMSHAPAYHRFRGSIQRIGAAAAGTASNPDVQDAADRALQKMQHASQQQMCSFDKLELHPGNIGYVKLSWFADPVGCGAIADAVMVRLNQTDAIIFDLRETQGGYPEMVRRMGSWFFDHPVPWYNPRATSDEQRTTRPDPASRLANKPMFILTSRQTFSGAEHFTYNLKMLKRATIVGERTSGASHAGAGALPSKVALAQPKPAWEGVGVTPDVRVNAEDALATAELLAQRALGEK